MILEANSLVSLGSDGNFLVESGGGLWYQLLFMPTKQSLTFNGGIGFLPSSKIKLCLISRI